MGKEPRDPRRDRADPQTRDGRHGRGARPQGRRQGSREGQRSTTSEDRLKERDHRHRRPDPEEVKQGAKRAVGDGAGEPDRARSRLGRPRLRGGHARAVDARGGREGRAGGRSGQGQRQGDRAGGAGARQGGRPGGRAERQGDRSGARRESRPSSCAKRQRKATQANETGPEPEAAKGGPMARDQPEAEVDELRARERRDSSETAKRAPADGRRRPQGRTAPGGRCSSGRSASSGGQPDRLGGRADLLRRCWRSSPR